MTDYYVVVGYYPDNDQPFSTSYDADDCDGWEDAIHMCRSEITAPLVVVAILDENGFVVDNLQETVQIDPLNEAIDCE